MSNGDHPAAEAWRARSGDGVHSPIVATVQRRCVRVGGVVVVVVVVVERRTGYQQRNTDNHTE